MTSSQANANAYLRTQVMSASPEQLRMMLIDGALKFAIQGRDGIVSKNHEQTYEGLSQCRAILTELMTSMKPEEAPELCERVRSLYAYMFQELVTAGMENDAAKVDGVIELLKFEQETWRMLLDQLHEERQSAQSSETTPRQNAPQTPGAGYSPLSIEG
ncbi:MAG TPA: flagellar export chaperone FliS [Phycisphaerales bacterium]|nr:flagellar export chaperone FliS [Phycisphaerales bacterium]